MTWTDDEGSKIMAVTKEQLKWQEEKTRIIKPTTNGVWNEGSNTTNGVWRNILEMLRFYWLELILAATGFVLLVQAIRVGSGL